MWRKKRTISSSKSTSALLMKPSSSFANNDNGSSDLDRSKHRCPSITNLLSIGTGIVDVDPAPSTQRTINIDKDEDDEENYYGKDRWSPNTNNGKEIGLVLDIIYDKRNNAYIDSDDDEDEDFEDSQNGNQILTTMNNDDNNNINKLKGQLPITDLTPLTRPTESFSSSSSQTSSGKVTEKVKKETATDIMMKLPESFTYFQTKKEKEDKEKKVGTTNSQHFPTNLHLLLDEAAEKGDHYSHTVSWCSQGKAFQIHDPDAFVQSPLLAKHFGQTQTKSFESFLRQLQAYDFHCCDKPGVVSHPLFRRGRRSLCFRMSQQKITSMESSSSLSSTAAINSTNNANDEYEDEDEEVYVVGYNDEEGSPYDYPYDYEGNNNNNNIGLDIDNDIDTDSINSEDDEEEQIDLIEGQQSQGETLLLVSDDNNSCKLRYRSKGATSAPDLTSLSSISPTTTVSSSQTTKIKKRNMSSTSLSSIMKKENSTNSLTSLRSSSSLVRFGSVEIHEHSIELGCSVHSLRKGPSLTLGWERTSYARLESIEDHKKQKETSPSTSKDKENGNKSSSSSLLRPRSVEERTDKLLENGYTLREIRSSLREDSKERTKLKKLAAKRRFRKRTMSLPDLSTFFSTRK